VNGRKIASMGGNKNGKVMVNCRNTSNTARTLLCNCMYIHGICSFSKDKEENKESEIEIWK